MPVEYKHGRAKENDADRLQLCAQAMALEEMLACDIQQAALFYEETRRRELVLLTDALRQKTLAWPAEMNQYFAAATRQKSSREPSATPAPSKSFACPHCTNAPTPGPT